MNAAAVKRQASETTQPPFDIAERTALFADRCIQAALALPNHGVAWELQRQFVRSSGSIGANLAEAKGTHTKPEFRQRVSVSLREAHETLYWLGRIANAELLPRKRLGPLMNEADESVSVLTAILKSTRRQDAT